MYLICVFIRFNSCLFRKVKILFFVDRSHPIASQKVNDVEMASH